MSFVSNNLQKATNHVFWKDKFLTSQLGKLTVKHKIQNILGKLKIKTLEYHVSAMSYIQL